MLGGIVQMLSVVAQSPGDLHHPTYPGAEIR